MKKKMSEMLSGGASRTGTVTGRDVKYGRG